MTNPVAVSLLHLEFLPLRKIRFSFVLYSLCQITVRARFMSREWKLDMLFSELEMPK